MWNGDSQPSPYDLEVSKSLWSEHNLLYKLGKFNLFDQNIYSTCVFCLVYIIPVAHDKDLSFPQHFLLWNICLFKKVVNMSSLYMSSLTGILLPGVQKSLEPVAAKSKLICGLAHASMKTLRLSLRTRACCSLTY